MSFFQATNTHKFSWKKEKVAYSGNSVFEKKKNKSDKLQKQVFLYNGKTNSKQKDNDSL